MDSIKLDVVTAERAVYSDNVDLVIAPGIEGQMGIMAQHTPLMTMMQPGELIARKGKEEFSLAVSGGFLEVRPDRVIVLADSAERADEIDIARAEEAKKRAEQRLEDKLTPEVDNFRAEAALRRSLIRLKVATKRKQRRTDF